MAFTPVSTLLPHFHSNSGPLLAGGTLYLYEAGTTTPAEFFTAAGVTLGTSEGLDARGEPVADLYLDSAGVYKFILKDASDVLIREWDNVSPPISANGTLEWLSPKSATYVDTNTFTIEGNPLDDAGVAIYHVGRRSRVLLQTSDTYVYATVSAASYNAGTDLTTIELANVASANGVAASLANEDLSAWVGLTVATAATALPGVIVALDYAALRAMTGAPVAMVLARAAPGDGGGGTFEWMSGNQSTNVTADPQSGMWVAPASDATGASGAWARVFSMWHGVDPEWFGAVRDSGGAFDSKPAIQAAIDWLSANPQGGGVVRIGPWDYHIGSEIQLRNRVRIIGAGGPMISNIRAISGFADTQMIRAEDGTTPFFHSRIEDIGIRGDGNVNVGIYAPAWQETCALRRVWLEGWMTIGFLHNVGHQGSAMFDIEECQIWPHSTATAASHSAIHLDSTFTVSYLDVGIRHCVFAGNANGETKYIGIRITGRTRVTGEMLHFENALAAVQLQDEAQYIGNGLAITGNIVGNGGVDTVFDVRAGWTGKIMVQKAAPGGATTFLSDLANSFIRFEEPPVVDPFIYPPDPTKPVAGGHITGTSTPSIDWAVGIGGVSRIGTGVFDLTLNPSMGNGANYAALVVSDSTAALSRITNKIAGGFRVSFADAGGALVDVDSFFVEVIHKSS